MKVIMKESTVRLTASQAFMVSHKKVERNRILDLAVRRLLSWDSYTNAPWDKAAAGVCSIGDGSTWLDVVEMGVDYKTKAVLLKPVNYAIPIETFKMLELAEKRVLKLRPKLEGKGIIAGIIRSAIEQDNISGMIGKVDEIE